MYPTCRARFPHLCQRLVSEYVLFAVLLSCRFSAAPRRSSSRTSSCLARVARRSLVNLITPRYLSPLNLTKGSVDMKVSHLKSRSKNPLAVDLLVVTLSAQGTACRCLRQSLGVFAIFCTMLTYGGFLRSTSSVACRWYAGKTLLSVPWRFKHHLSKSLFFGSPSIAIFVRHPKRPIAS